MKPSPTYSTAKFALGVTACIAGTIGFMLLVAWHYLLSDFHAGWGYKAGEEPPAFEQCVDILRASWEIFVSRAWPGYLLLALVLLVGVRSVLRQASLRRERVMIHGA